MRLPARTPSTAPAPRDIAKDVALEAVPALLVQPSNKPASWNLRRAALRVQTP